MGRLLATVFLFCIIGAGAQSEVYFSKKEDRDLFESGRSLYDDKLYPLAYEHFNKLLYKHPKDLYLKYLTGICGIFISDKHDEALIYLNEVKSRNPKAADIDYYFALLYHKTYQFGKSIELATALLQKPELSIELRRHLEQVINYCNNGLSIVTHELPARIENIGSPPNSEDAEYSPVLSADEETLLFTYRGKLSKGGLRDVYDRPNKYGFYYEDVYMSRKVNGKWQKAESAEDINTESNEAVLAISNDGQQLYIYRASPDDGGDIYMSRLMGDKFGPPEKLKGEINSPGWEGSISISGDQKKAIFASDRPGGNGGKDLYEAVNLGGNTWGNVKNLGAAVNTPFDDDAPSLHPDGRSLVFSSRGHNSIGDYDIFLSELNENDSSWKAPLNVGYPINTTDDDIYYFLSADGKRGYFSSAKTGGLGDKDIYVEEPVVFSKKSFLTVVKGKITENLLPYAGEIAVFYARDQRNYGLFKSNPISGNYLISLPSGNDYFLAFYHPVLGEKVVNVDMQTSNGYAELPVNINFGESDTSTRHQSIFVGPRDTSRLRSVTDKHSKFEGDVESEKALIKKMTRDQLMARYGQTKVSDLTYQVQVGAYRHPQNFNGTKLENLASVAGNGKIKGDISLLIANKEFDTFLDADVFLRKVKGAGQADAFITARLKGRRYYIAELVQMGIWAGKELLSRR